MRRGGGVATVYYTIANVKILVECLTSIASKSTIGKLPDPLQLLERIWVQPLVPPVSEVPLVPVPLESCKPEMLNYLVPQVPLEPLVFEVPLVVLRHLRYFRNCRHFRHHSHPKELQAPQTLQESQTCTKGTCTFITTKKQPYVFVVS